MSVSRRRFLGVAACAVSGVFAAARSPGQSDRRTAVRTALDSSSAGSSCALVDLESDCALPESFAGFERGLVAASAAFEHATAGKIPFARLILVPGAVLRSARTAQTLRDLADDGATVVYESGAAYADSESVTNEQRLLARCFGLRVDAPIDVWRPNRGAAFAPYVHYTWPSSVMIRDFSRVMPVASQHRTFATLGELPVAGCIRIGAGEFIFLGSTLGPHLWSGDQEARTLLEAFVRFPQSA